VNLLKQSKIPFIGEMKEVFSSSFVYISCVNFVLMGITAYSTTLKPYFDSIGWTWFNLFVFFPVMILFVATMMFLEYKFVMKSVYEFRNRQEYKHESLIRKDLDEIKKKLGIN
jgi:hypothetical protein